MELMAIGRLEYSIKRIESLEMRVNMDSNEKMNTIIAELHDVNLYLKEILCIMDTERLVRNNFTPEQISTFTSHIRTAEELYIALFYDKNDALFPRIYQLIKDIKDNFENFYATLSSDIAKTGMYIRASKDSYTHRQGVHEQDLQYVSNRLCGDNTDRVTIKIFDPECKRGYSLNRMSNATMAYGKYLSYGLNVGYPEHSNQAKNLLDHVIKGNGRGSMITNECFDVVFLQPNLEFESGIDDEGHMKHSDERIDILKTTKYVREEGITMLVLPFYRLTYSICRLISKHYTDIHINSVRAITQDPKDDMQEVMIIMRRKKDHADWDKNMEYLMRNIEYLSYDRMTTGSLATKNLKLPDNVLDVSIFKGSIFDEDDIRELLNSSELYEDAIVNTDEEKQIDNSPLIPFNIGQIGLVLTSGQLDGVVTDKDNSKHVIKGRVVKKITKDSKTDFESNEMEETTTTSHQVQINLFTANGKFIQLT